MFVRNAERSQQWYADVLELHTYGCRPGRVAFMAADLEQSHEIALVQVGEEAPGPRTRGVGLNHMAWMMESLDDLKDAYAVYKKEAHDIAPEYAPETVNTDGWKGTKAAWKILFEHVVILQCFLHAWLKVRERGKHLKDQFAEVSRRVWEAYHAPDRRCFGQRIRSLRTWAEANLSGVVREKVLDLCKKRDRWSIAYRHPEGHRTSNMLDRLMRGMNRYFEDGQHLHGSSRACRLHCRAWALLWNFAPWHPATARKNRLTVFGAHADQRSVRALATAVVRLKRTLAHFAITL